MCISIYMYNYINIYIHYILFGYQWRFDFNSTCHVSEVPRSSLRARARSVGIVGPQHAPLQMAELDVMMATHRCGEW